MVGKNIRPLGGIPLVGWAIRIARHVERISRVIISTDSDEIAQVSRKWGGEVPFIRPAELAQDQSPEWLVWRHALDFLSADPYEHVDGLVVIPATAPLRNVQDIDNCIDEYERGDVDVVVTYSDANRNPHFNMIVKQQDGYCSLVIPPREHVTRRQEAPVVYDMTTVAYVARPEFVKECNGIFEGRVRGVYIDPERAVDIDTALDFKIAEFLAAEMSGKKKR